MIKECRQALKHMAILLLSIALLLLMVGCGDKSEPEKLTDNIEQIQGMDEYAPSGELAEAFSDDVTYEVVDISWNGEKGTAEVRVSTPDLSRIISESIRKAIDECGMENYEVLLTKTKGYVQKTLNSDDCPMMDSVVEMEAKKTDDGYTLISNDEFGKIISGNVEEIFARALMEGLVNENSN